MKTLRHPSLFLSCFLMVSTHVLAEPPNGAPPAFDVVVVNTPLSVTIVDTNFDRVPYNRTIIPGLLAGEKFHSFNLLRFPDDFPEGTSVFVVEQLSYRVTLGLGESAQVWFNASTVGGHSVFMNQVDGVVLDGEVVFGDTKAVRVYVGDPDGDGFGGVLEVVVQRDVTAGAGRLNASVSGYFISADSLSLSP